LISRVDVDNKGLEHPARKLIQLSLVLLTKALDKGRCESPIEGFRHILKELVTTLTIAKFGTGGRH